MIALNETSIWEKLSGPYQNSDEIPALLTTLTNSFKKEVADELIWEYMYHQGSTYETTLAIIPHLIKIIERANEEDFKLDVIISLGIVLIGYDANSNVSGVFTGQLSQEIEKRITTSFFKALITYKKLVFKYTPKAKHLDESSKRYFLAAYLVSTKMHREASVFINFNGNDEYMFVCPKCDEEYFLWNEENVLNGYLEDPVFEEKRKISIAINNSNINLSWLEEMIAVVNIASLKPMIPYFKGSIVCMQCSQETIVFNGILNSLR